MLHATGQGAKLVQISLRLPLVHNAAHFAQRNRQAKQRNQLRGKGFGRCHANFCPRAGVKHQFAGAGQRGFHHIANRQAVLVSQRLRVFQGFHRIQRFARLRNGDDELFGVGNHIAVAVFAGDFYVCWDFGDAFQPIFAGGRGVKRCTAGENFDAVNVAEHLLGVRAKIAGDKAAF